MSVAAVEPVRVAAEQAVRAAGLGRAVDDAVILRDVTFDVARGRLAVLLGANGAGKSTLLGILAGLVPATSGTLTLFGASQTAATRARIGLIGHAPMLYRDLTARENLVFFGRLYGVRDPAGRADALLEEIGLARRGGDPVRTFSRGMAQRVAIARALVHDPDLLLADEPFAGLDAPSRRTLETMLRRLHAGGRTIVLASHDLEQSLRVAEQALVLRRGRLVVDAPTSGLDRATVLAEVTGP